MLFCPSLSAGRGNIHGELHHPATCKPLSEQSSTDLEKVCLPTAAQLEGRNPLNGSAECMEVGRGRMNTVSVGLRSWAVPTASVLAAVTACRHALLRLST